MRVKGLVWLGLRTSKFAETVKLFRDVMGMEMVRDEAEIAGFKLVNNTGVEVYRPEEEFHAFFNAGPVGAFLVDDVHDAPAELEAAAISFIGPIRRARNNR